MPFAPVFQTPCWVVTRIAEARWSPPWKSGPVEPAPPAPGGRHAF
jgi:hypothetical protein